MSDIALFFAEQDEIMNQPEEDFSDYLARRHHTTNDASCKFSMDTITADSLSAINYLQKLTANPEPPSPTSLSPDSNAPAVIHDSLKPLDQPLQAPQATNSQQCVPQSVPQPASSTSPQPPSGKHMPDRTGAEFEQPPAKKRKGADEQAASSSRSVARRDTARSSDPPHTTRNVSAGVATHLPLAALSAMGPEARSEEGASGSTVGIMSEPPRPSAASAELKQSNQSLPCGDKKAVTGKSESARADSSSVANGPTKRPHRQTVVTTSTSVRLGTLVKGLPPPLKYPSTTADSSNITTPPSTAQSAKPAAVSSKSTARTVRAVATRGTNAAQKQKGKKKKELIPPFEYAQRLEAERLERQPGGKKTKYRQFLEGARVFYYGGDVTYAGESTRRRMEIIIRHGGSLAPKFDPDTVTHIVNDGGKYGLLETIGLKKMSDIPERIIVVNWDWMLDGQSGIVRRSSSAGETLKGKQPAAVASKKKNTDGDASANEHDSDYDPESDDNHVAFWDEVRTSGSGVPKQTAVAKGETAAQKNKKQQQLGGGGDRSTDASSDDISHISDFTQDELSPGNGAKGSLHAGPLPSPPSSPRNEAHPSRAAALPSGEPRPHTSRVQDGAGASKPTFDPLAEFYEQAREEKAAEMFADGESGDEGVRKRANLGGKKSRFVCDDKGGNQRRGSCPNQDVIDKLSELKALHEARPTDDDKWRAFTLRKAINAVRRYPKRIETVEEATKLPGVGTRTAQKIVEVIKTGALERIKWQSGEDIETVRLLHGIYNVGFKTAWTWYKNGCRTLEDVAAGKGGITLSPAQRIGLEYYNDINTRIPRSEVQEIFDIIKAEALKIDPKLFVEVMGSFRRGKASCGDIDVLITRPTDDGKTHRGIIRKLLTVLHNMGVVTEDLSLPENFQDLETVYHGLCRRDPQSLRRRIDFLTVPWSSRGAALLYYTGDDIFNRSLRWKANKMGYSLNQRGLYADVVRDPGDRTKKLHEGTLVASESEQEILAILEVPWQEPHERIRS